jgi:hypothetical protein
MNIGLNVSQYASSLLATISGAGIEEYNLDCKVL